MPDFMAKKFAMQLNQIVVPQSESYILFAVCKHSPAAFLKNAKKICRERFSLGIQSHFQAEGAEVLSPECARGEGKRRCASTMSECRVTCYRVKRRSIKSSVFPSSNSCLEKKQQVP